LNEILTHYPLAFVVTTGVIGLLVGSFLNVLIWRLPKMLEREWRLQAHDILGLPGETPLPTYNLLLPIPSARTAVTGFGPGKIFRCSVSCCCADAARLARHRSANDTH
jgi:prepilin signal peptidase PulO-like enzyme (type II secretory pathway)